MVNRQAWKLGGVAIALAVGCGDSDEDRPGGSGSGIASASNGTESATGGASNDDDNPTDPSATSVATSSVDTSPVADETGYTPKFDLGTMPDFALIEEGCQKVDFLFTIDNSGSMAGDQANLIANFPAFINGIQSVLASVDEYQVGVVTTDTYSSNVAGCTGLSGLVVQTGGSNSSNQACGPYAAGANYMTELDNLATEFSCAAQVGTSGSAAERQMQATVEAVQKVLGNPGECNDGYLRDDSLLVIVIITDESDTDSTGNSMTWFNDIVAARAGIEENIAVVSLINTPGGICSGSVANGISDFTNMFTNGFQADVCIPDYGPIFQQAIGIIENACDNFTPPG